MFDDNDGVDDIDNSNGDNTDNVLLDTHHHAPIIGYHHAALSQKFGAPRQPNLVALTSVIEMLAPYDTPAAFVGLEAFSHIWIGWQFHHNHIHKTHALNHSNSRFHAQVRPPRLGGNQKIGVFASRSMYRPSALGLSVVKLERIDIVEGRVLLIISGADMIDGTPIIDIKPYVAYSDALTDTQSGFASSAPSSLEVSITDSAYEQFLQSVAEQHKADKQPTSHANQTANKRTVAETIQQTTTQLLMSDLEVIKALIAQDPRPAYRRTEIGTVFVMRYKSVDVSFQMIALDELQIRQVTVV